ncbi:MAG: AfsR/SARP family transcriptional regulator [Egibacteraceae bacterium]
MGLGVPLRHPTTSPADGASEPRRLRLALMGGFGLAQQDAEVVVPLSAQRLLAFLALHPHPVLRVHVAGSLWPDSTQAGSAASLRSALWRLRRPGLPVVCATSRHLGLADGVAVDAREVVAAVHRLTDRSAPCRAEDFDPAALTGQLLPDWTADDWVLIERERLRQLCLHGLEALCERLLALGRHAEAVEAGLAAVHGEPLRESAHRVLISVHLAQGNHCEALREYRWYRRLLWDELGIAPSPLIIQLVAGLQPAG